MDGLRSWKCRVFGRLCLWDFGGDARNKGGETRTEAGCMDSRHDQNGRRNGQAPSEMIGVIGLGLLGRAIAQRLLKLGYSLVGYDVDPERRALASSDGVAIAADSPEVVAQCDRVILSLPTSEVVESVVDEISSQLRPGQFLIDTTTGEPDAIAALAEKLAARSVDYLDATV